MDFKKKLKIRLFLAIGYIALGVAMIVLFLFVSSKNDFLSSFGLALVVIGIVRIRQYAMITKNEETIMRRQIAEGDERNISIANKAKSAAFIIYVFVTCIAIIVLQLIDYTILASILSATVGLLILIYWISYWIIRKRS